VPLGYSTKGKGLTQASFSHAKLLVAKDKLQGFEKNFKSGPNPGYKQKKLRTFVKYTAQKSYL
jgi:hypothetical protein